MQRRPTTRATSNPTEPASPAARFYTKKPARDRVSQNDGWHEAHARRNDAFATAANESAPDGFDKDSHRLPEECSTLRREGEVEEQRAMITKGFFFTAALPIRLSTRTSVHACAQGSVLLPVALTTRVPSARGGYPRTASVLQGFRGSTLTTA